MDSGDGEGLRRRPSRGAGSSSRRTESDGRADEGHRSATPSPPNHSTPSTAAIPRPPPVRSAGSSEYYGFALFTLSTVLWVVWVLWALVPQQVLEAWGVLWMPSREWAYLLPAWSMAAMLFAYAAYLSLNIMHTAAPDDRKSFVDEHSTQGGGTSATDMPYGLVSRTLYLLPEHDHPPHPAHSHTSKSKEAT